MLLCFGAIAIKAQWYACGTVLDQIFGQFKIGRFWSIWKQRKGAGVLIIDQICVCFLNPIWDETAKDYPNHMNCIWRWPSGNFPENLPKISCHVSIGVKFNDDRRSGFSIQYWSRRPGSPVSIGKNVSGNPYMEATMSWGGITHCLQ